MSDSSPPRGGATDPGWPPPPAAQDPATRPTTALSTATPPGADSTSLADRATDPDPPVVGPTATRRRGGLTEIAPLVVKLLATLSVGAFAVTFAATEVDLVRRHFPGIEPGKYWLPQFRQITLPGLGATLFCAALAYTLHRLRRRS